MERKEIESIVEKVVEEFATKNRAFPVEVSARHVHLNQVAVDELFGSGAELKVKRDLSLPGFLAEQRVSIVTQKGVFQNVAVLGPTRSHVQVELSAADARTLGLSPPVNLSGNLKDAEDVLLVGAKGSYYAKGSAIIARAHIHMSPEEAPVWGLKDKQIVDVSIEGGKRSILMKDIVVRINDGMHGMMHIDTDEANACCVSGKMYGRVCVQGCDAAVRK